MTLFKNFAFDNFFFKLGVMALVLIFVLQTSADMFNWYYIFPKLDTPMHILGGMLVGFFALTYHVKEWSGLQKLIWVLGWSLAVGIAVEVAEYLLDVYAHLGVTLQGSSLDTYTDILHDVTGGVIAFAIGYFGNKL